MMNNPQVSVIMPVYNGGEFLRRAIDSVFLQDVSLELYLIDDCSTEDLNPVIEDYLKRPDFHYIRNETNLGAAASRNRGVRECSGTYVAYLDADDWWEAGKLKHQLYMMKKYSAVLSTTGRELVREDGTDTGHYIPVPAKISYASLLKHNCINCSSVVVLRYVAIRFPMEHEDSHEDYIAWLRILKEYPYAVGIDRPYLNYRLRENSKSGTKLKSAGMTFKVYRYMGYGPIRSLAFFASYAVHGIMKYFLPSAGRKQDKK